MTPKIQKTVLKAVLREITKYLTSVGNNYLKEYQLNTVVMQPRVVTNFSLHPLNFVLVGFEKTLSVMR